MSGDEFSELKQMFGRLSEKVESLTQAINDYKLEISQTMNSFDNRITRIEQRCADQHDGGKRLTDNIYKAVPIIIMLIMLLINLWSKK